MSDSKATLFQADVDAFLEEIGAEKALEMLDEMLLIRHFEQRGEQSYQMGKVWGFYHAYIGQEAIQTAVTNALGKDKNLYATTYRCHALALLLGMTAKEGMAELFGKATGNAKGRGGSMHMYAKNMFGGSGIVGGQWPLGLGLAFSLKYKEIKDEVAVVFGGDGSVPQGTFHETMNLAMLWKVPLIVVIENNRMSMGTQEQRTIANLPAGENMAKAYGVKSYGVNGMHIYDVYKCFQEAKEYVLEKSEPVIIEAFCYRFKGHSISDAAPYRTKEELAEIMKQDPIEHYKNMLMEKCGFTEEDFKQRSDKQKNIVLEAVKEADEAEYPPLTSLEEGVVASE